MSWVIWHEEAEKEYGFPITMDELLGLIPAIIRQEDPRPVREQVADRYAHGGGWHPFGQGAWRLGSGMKLQFPGDPAMKPLAATTMPLSGEVVYLYAHSMILVMNSDHNYEVSRMD
jgi:hypothetical protein